MNKYPVFTDDYMNEYNQMSKEERKNCGAVWTPPEIISQMMADFPEEDWANPTKTMLDPTCGTGNIIVCMILNKLYHGVSPYMAVKNTYGVELLQKNVEICRNRVCKIVGEKYRKIVEHNIVCSNIFKWNLEAWRPYTKKELEELAKKDPSMKKYLL
jgi:hypothetical protein